MAIQLTKATEHELKAKVHSGPYRSVNDVIREGLALIEERDAFRQAVREGEAQLARGQIVTRSQSRARMRKLAAQLKKTR
jgi:putative addiction module CopG family antidote